MEQIVTPTTSPSQLTVKEQLNQIFAAFELQDILESRYKRLSSLYLDNEPKVLAELDKMMVEDSVLIELSRRAGGKLKFENGLWIFHPDKN